MTAPDHKRPHAAESDGTPKFGRLLIVLALVVMLIVVITFASEKYLG